MDLSKTLTVYGRKPVLEALRDPTLDPHRLHLADKNKPGGIISEIETAAKKRSIPIAHHDRLALSRISKNGKQDQGVALDLFCPNFSTLDIFLTDFERNPEKKFKALLLDGITNPQNVGMIIRSSCAAGIDAIFYPKKSVATLGPLVIKASVGTAFRAPIVFCEESFSCATALKARGVQIAVMDSHATLSLFEHQKEASTVFVLGGETEGASETIKNAANLSLRIPMKNGVESLNVAVTAALIGFLSE